MTSPRFVLISPGFARQHIARAFAKQSPEEGPAMIVGSGRFKYLVNANWAKLPDGWSFKEVGGVGVDSNDNVYVFNRGEHIDVVVAVDADPADLLERPAVRQFPAFLGRRP